MGVENLQFEVNRSDYKKYRLVEENLGDLPAGSVRMKIKRFALTANNVTYATFGDMLGYWDFYPAADGWGRVPAMGWATVEESNNPDVAAGGNYYGWFPMGRYVDIAAKASGDGIHDVGEHRAAHAITYRSLVESSKDPFYQEGEDAEDRHALLRGLTATGYLIDDFFADSDYMGAERKFVVSASSKTAIGYAMCAALRNVSGVTALTSEANATFVEKLGCYESVVTYDAISGLDPSVSSVIIDMAGNANVRAALHNLCGDSLKYSMMVGGSHHDAPADDAPLPGPAPELFFAPSQIDKRIAELGSDTYRARLSKALTSVIGASGSWLTVSRTSGGEAVTGAWQALLDGKVPPDIGQIVSV